MADLEDDLRRVLNDPAHALPPWPDAVQRVRTGMRRRHGRRLLARLWAGLALVLAALAVAIGPSLVTEDKPPLTLPSPSPSASVIPWADLPMAEPPQPSASARPVLAECRVADLHRLPIETDGAGGTLMHFVRLRNDGKAACTLTGRPRVRGVLNGHLRDIPTGEPIFKLVPGQVPATIDPGEYADLVIETYGSCLDGRPQTVYKSARIVVGGTELSLHDSLNTTCGVGEAPWHRQQPEPVEVGTGLFPSIEGPVTQTPDRELVFVVRLTNTTASAIALDPCPNYLAEITLNIKLGGMHRLNCTDAQGTTRVIPPGGSLDFAMRLPIVTAGANNATGDATLTWLLNNDVTATAPVVIR